jgi:hypothetical protein
LQEDNKVTPIRIMTRDAIILFILVIFFNFAKITIFLNGYFEDFIGAMYFE